jgi:hypothetical protein
VGNSGSFTGCGTGGSDGPGSIACSEVGPCASTLSLGSSISSVVALVTSAPSPVSKSFLRPKLSRLGPADSGVAAAWLGVLGVLDSCGRKPLRSTDTKLARTVEVGREEALVALAAPGERPRGSGDEEVASGFSNMERRARTPPTLGRGVLEDMAEGRGRCTR